MKFTETGMRMICRHPKQLILAIVSILLASEVAFAADGGKTSTDRDFYLAVFGGASFPENATLRGGSDLSLGIKGGPSGGLKAGWMLPGQHFGGWFNWEFEYWYQNNKVKQQDLPGIGNIPGANGHFHIFSSNFILRRPTGKIQPYVGLGPSLVYADINGPGPTATSPFGPGNQSAKALGLNFLAGTRIKFTETVGMFIEYKRNTAYNAVFDGGSFNFTTNVIATGLSWDFDSIELP
jgi:hypothetical protein